MWKLWLRLVEDERGQGLVEYALIILFVAIACVGALTTFGGLVSSSISTSAAAIP